MFNTTIYKAHVESEDHNESSGESIEFANPQTLRKQGVDLSMKYACWDKVDTNGFPKVGAYIEEDDVYVGKVNKHVVSNRDDETVDRFSSDYAGGMEVIYRDRSTVATAITSGTIDAVYVYDKDTRRKLKIRFRKTRTPVLGDKFASRHGQKGVVGMILPQEDMPRTKDGVVPDMIINPHAIPSRMTIGHLIECVVAKYGCAAGTTLDGTIFENMDTTNYYQLLEKSGYNRHGDEILYNGYTGEQMATKIFMGPTFYCRLKHMVNDKMNYRGGNDLDPAKNPKIGTTKQPSHGRASGGGLRIGEMETNALISHGIGHFIQESMMERSDKYQVSFDGNSGSIAVEHPDGLSSMVDDTSINFKRVRIPYTMKLLIQEMEALGLKAQICFEDNKCDTENEYYEDAYFEVDPNTLSQEDDVADE
jgi:DNA-directed RNA polymerase II subunit RPB2